MSEAPKTADNHLKP